MSAGAGADDASTAARLMAPVHIQQALVRNLALLDFPLSKYAVAVGGNLDIGVHMFHRTNDKALNALLHFLLSIALPRFSQVSSVARGAGRRESMQCAR